MIKKPHTYAEWVEALDILKAKTDDEEVLAAMQKGTIEWQTGVAERFSKRLIDTVNYRMDGASDKFQRDLNNAHGEEGAIVRALLSLRKEMAFLARAIDLPVLPEKDRSHYKALVIDQANTMQKSLEDSAKKDYSGKLLNIIRNHKVNTI